MNIKAKISTVFLIILFSSTTYGNAAENTDLREYIEDKLVVARSYYRQGFFPPRDPIHFDRALEEYKKILEVDPWHEEAVVGIADIYTARKNYEEAEKLYRRAIKTDAWNTEYRVKLGFHYVTRDLYKEALKEADRVIDYEPGNTKAHFIRAIAYGEIGDPSDAINEYKYAIEYFEIEGRETLEMDARLRLGKLYLKENLIFDGVEQYEEVVKSAPKFIPGYLELANTYYRLGRVDMSILTLKKLIKINSGVPHAYVMLAIIYFNKGDYDASFAYFKKAEALEVKFKGALWDTYYKVRRFQEERSKI